MRDVRLALSSRRLALGKSLRVFSAIFPASQTLDWDQLLFLGRLEIPSSGFCYIRLLQSLALGGARSETFH